MVVTRVQEVMPPKFLAMPPLLRGSVNGDGSIMEQTYFELVHWPLEYSFKQGLVHNDHLGYLLASWCKVGSEACLNLLHGDMWIRVTITVWILPRPAKG